jgi:hypothetical protein
VEFPYNSHCHKSSGISPFEADLGYIPKMPLDTMATTRCRRSPRGHPEAHFSTYMAGILKELKMALAHAEEQQTAEANFYRQPHTFQEGDNIFLSTKNLPLTYANNASGQGHRKALQHKYLGEFTLGKQHGENDFEINLPKHWKLARTFNVSAMKPSTIDRTRNQAEPPPMRIETVKGIR